MHSSVPLVHIDQGSSYTRTHAREEAMYSALPLEHNMTRLAATRSQRLLSQLT